LLRVFVTDPERAILYQNQRRSEFVRRAVIAISVLLALFMAALVAVGEYLSHPAQHPVGDPPRELGAETVRIGIRPGQSVAAWIVRGESGKGLVLLLHGIRADRRQMLERARFLKALGYSITLIDLPSHGESDGARITFGFREAEGVGAALDYLHTEFPHEKIGVIGASLGAASFVLAKPNFAPDAVVLESMFPTIADAVSDRLKIHLGAYGDVLAPLLLWQLPLRTGISADQIRPIDVLPTLHSPVMIASGSIDRNTTLRETRDLFSAANAPKELWIVEGAGHQDLYAFSGAQYERKVSAFLGKYLRDSSAD
jgi:fermentation-respiration switch protein FrsA (DUF1100 family)